MHTTAELIGTCGCFGFESRADLVSLDVEGQKIQEERCHMAATVTASYSYFMLGDHSSTAALSHWGWLGS